MKQHQLISTRMKKRQNIMKPKIYLRSPCPSPICIKKQNLQNKHTKFGGIHKNDSNDVISIIKGGEEDKINIRNSSSYYLKQKQQMLDRTSKERNDKLNQSYQTKTLVNKSSKRHSNRSLGRLNVKSGEVYSHYKTKSRDFIKGIDIRKSAIKSETNLDNKQEQQKKKRKKSWLDISYNPRATHNLLQKINRRVTDMQEYEKINKKERIVQVMKLTLLKDYQL